MSENPKPMIREALVRASKDGQPLTHEELGKKAGFDYNTAHQAIFKRVDPERAGRFCVVLGELAGLSASERRQVFAEMIHYPGEAHTKESVVEKVSSEDPKVFLKEAARKAKPGHYSSDANKAGGLRPREGGESNAAEDRSRAARDAERTEREEG